MIRVLLRRILVIFIYGGLVLGAHSQSIAAPVYEEVGTIVGPAGGQSNSFMISATGSYLAKITDLTFFPGSSFDIVALGISTNSLLLGSTFLVSPSTNDSASFIFSAVPGKYFSNVAATCNGICSFGVDIMAVPLPPALGLFSLGLLGLVLISRRLSR